MTDESLMISNVFYESDVNYSIQVNRWLLKILGAWPRSFTDSKIIQTLMNATTCWCYFLFIFVTAPCLLQLLFEEEDVQLRIKNFFPVIVWFMAFLKYSFLLFHGNGIYNCLKEMEIDWRVVDNLMDRDIMLGNAKIGRYITGSSVVWIYSGAAFYFGGTAVYVSTLPGNETVSVRLLPFPFYSKFMDTTISPLYEIIFFVQIVMAMTVSTVVVTTTSLLTVLVLHITGQLKILKRLVETFINQQEEEVAIRKRLGSIVQRHLRILRFIARLESIMNQICLVELLGSILLMCFIGYLTIKEWEQNDIKNLMTFLMLSIFYTLNIFIFCFIGEILSEQCRQIGEAAYMTEWYQLSGKTGLDLVLIILISSSLIKLTAGKVMKLSLSSFTDVIKSAMAYLNILRTMTTR